jgi:hypothetical protein
LENEKMSELKLTKTSPSGGFDLRNLIVDDVKTVDDLAEAVDAKVDAVVADGTVKVSALPSGAGLATLLAAGLGASEAFAKNAEATAHEMLDASGAGDTRAVLVVVSCDEAFDVGTGTKPTFKVGEEDTVEKFFAATDIQDLGAGDVLVAGGTLTAEKAFIVTSTAAIGNATGGITVTVLALPAEVNGD